MKSTLSMLQWSMAQFTFMMCVDGDVWCCISVCICVCECVYSPVQLLLCCSPPHCQVQCRRSVACWLFEVKLWSPENAPSPCSKQHATWHFDCSSHSVSFSALALLIGWLEGCLICKNHLTPNVLFQTVHISTHLHFGGIFERSRKHFCIVNSSKLHLWSFGGIFFLGAKFPQICLKYYHCFWNQEEDQQTQAHLGDSH